MPSKRKKMRQEKQKVKVKTALEILLSAHARTSQGDILHLDQKAVKCTTCKQVSDQKTTREASKRVFRQNLRKRMG